MIKLTRFTLVALLGLIPACGGGSEDGDAGMPADAAGPDGPPVALGNDALGAYNGAHQIAVGIQADEQLYKISGDYLAHGGREVDPNNPTSFWTFYFISVGTGKTVSVIYSGGEYGPPYESTANPESVKVLPDWINSTTAVDYMEMACYISPTDGDTDYRVGTTLEMSPDPTLTDPVWRYGKIYAPPGMTPINEDWLALYSESNGGYVVCPPAAGNACSPDGSCLLFTP